MGLEKKDIKIWVFERSKNVFWVYLLKQIWVEELNRVNKDFFFRNIYGLGVFYGKDIVSCVMNSNFFHIFYEQSRNFLFSIRPFRDNVTYLHAEVQHFGYNFLANWRNRTQFWKFVGERPILIQTKFDACRSTKKKVASGQNFV